jgi:hypothetical protein
VPAEQIVQLVNELCATAIVAASIKKEPAGHPVQVDDTAAPVTVE